MEDKGQLRKIKEGRNGLSREGGKERMAGGEIKMEIEIEGKRGNGNLRGQRVRRRIRRKGG